MLSTQFAPSHFTAGSNGALRRVVNRVLSMVSGTPATPAKRTRTQEADDLRAMADQFLRSDPGFADDLYAAATRHEMAA